MIEEKLDFAFVFAGKEKSALSYLKLARQELVICCSRRHRFRRNNLLHLKEIKDEPLILPNSSSFFKELLRKIFGEFKITPNVIAEISHVQTIKNLIATGVGVSILPEELCEQDENLTTVALEPPIYLYPLLAYKKNRHPSHAAEAFLNLSRKEVDNNA